MKVMKVMSDWEWWLGGAYFFTESEARGAYRGCAYKKAKPITQ